ncbi:MAG: undecaprenyl-diphosphate phosphatase [bacterium]|nr:undecaprenyl-diphosphate phosphatase [bacterium]
MDILQATILGIVEGVTEFLPVSSTFHLIWTAKFLNIEHNAFQKLFEVAIQSGAILAVVVSFAKTTRNNPSLIKKVLIAFIPTAIIGFFLYNIIKNVFLEHAALQISMFIAIGIIFILFERLFSKPLTRTISSITYQEAFMVGIAQSLAVIPGVSRAGAVILALMALTFNRKDAAVFSFLLAVPTILAASIFDIAVSQQAIRNNQDIFLLAIGLLAAFVTALAVVKWLLNYLETHTLRMFGWYRIALGLLLLIFGSW